MIEFTRNDFVKEFGVPPSKLFDLDRCIENRSQLEIEAMRLPDPKLARVRAQYGTLKADNKEDLIFCLDIAYWIDNGRFQASIQKVTIFDDQTEQDLHKAMIAANAPNWNDN